MGPVWFLREEMGCILVMGRHGVRWKGLTPSRRAYTATSMEGGLAPVEAGLDKWTVVW